MKFIKNTHIICNKVDVWSVGCIMYELLLGKRPFNGSEKTQIEYLNSIVKNE